MELLSTTKIDIPIDLSLDVTEDSGDYDSTNFDDSIPFMDGIPPNTFFGTETLHKLRSLSFLYTAAPFPFIFNCRSCFYSHGTRLI